MQTAFFNNKKITMMGLGVLGRSVGEAIYLAEHGADLIITDLKLQDMLQESLDKLAHFDNIQFVLGEHRLQDFRGRDLILKGPSVPLDSEYIAEARKEGTPIEMSASLMVKLSGVKTIGVTGTRGKSTTTHLLHDILTRAGQHTVLGGNIRGVANLPLLDDVTDDTIALLELDSWQLQGFGDAGMSPHIAIFTTFMRDHMNYYNGDEEAYLADKANIFLNQTKNDHLIIGRQAARKVMDVYRGQFRSEIHLMNSDSIQHDWTVRMPGEHNRYNAACAMEAARVLEIPDEIIKESLAEFEGMEGRCSFVGTFQGVNVYNDTNATTPEASVAALAALDTSEKNVVLIAGGEGKGLDMQPFV